MVKERIKHLIFETRTPLQGVLWALMLLVSVLAIGTTIYYHGFPHTQETRDLLLTVNKLFFIVFIVNYLVKLGLAPDSKAFLRQNWLEAVLLLLVIYDAISYYIFKVPVVNRIFSYLNIDPLSSKYAFFIQFFLILLII